MAEFRIRAAQREDIPLLVTMIRELAEYEKMLEQACADEQTLAEEMFFRRRVEGLILEEEYEPVGYCLFFHNFSSFVGRAGLFVEDIYVRPAYRGKGYGKAVFRYLARLAQERKCGRMEWTCLHWNAPSIAFYEGLGAQAQPAWMIFRMNGEQIAELAGQ